MTSIVYCAGSSTVYIFRGPMSDDHHCTGVVYYDRAATIVCYNSSWMYTLHTSEDLASAGDTVDVMRWMKGRITLWGPAGLCGFVVTWCSSGTHVVPRVLAAQASSLRFDFQHIFLHFSHTWNMVHVLAYFCRSCFYETTFLGIIWQMMQTQHWNVSSCLCEIVCFLVETERAQLLDIS